MKTPILFALVTFTLANAAQASWYQTFCSNAVGTTRTANGHGQNFIQLTKRVWTQQGFVETVIRDEKRELVEEQVGERKIIVSEQRNDCRNSGTGVWSKREVNAGKYKIVHREGKLFGEDIVGVSKDLKSVEVEMICQHEMNGLIMCPKK